MSANGGPVQAGNGRPPALTYAGLATRTLAFAIDAAIVNCAAWLTGAVIALGLSLFSLPHSVQVALAAIGAALGFLWVIAYFTFFWSADGQTPGDRVMRIRVLRASTGEPIHALRALLRVLVLPLSALPLCAGFLMILVDDRRRALHDRLVGTVVVHTLGSRRPRRTPVRTLAVTEPLQEAYHR
jgi:uncharacterized RDD family membrane protein YckC